MGSACAIAAWLAAAGWPRRRGPHVSEAFLRVSSARAPIRSPESGIEGIPSLPFATYIVRRCQYRWRRDPARQQVVAVAVEQRYHTASRGGTAHTVAE